MDEKERRRLEKESPYNQFIGEYIAKEDSTTPSRAGKLIDIVNGVALLLPFSTAVYGKEGPRRFIQEEGLSQTKDLRSMGISVTQTTRKEIEDYNNYFNIQEVQRRENIVKVSKDQETKSNSD